MARLCEGRVAIVTGGARGVGREHCLMLAEHGAKVVVNDLGGDRAGAGQDISAAQQVVNEIKAKGGQAVLGLAVTPDASPRLAEPRNEGWSERLKSKIALTSPADVDAELKALLKAAWDRS